MNATSSTKPRLTRWSLIIITLLTAAFLWFKSSSSNIDEATAQQPSQQAFPVVTSVAELKSIHLWKAFSAQLAAVNYAEIRPQVRGMITEVNMEDNQHVQKGDVLFIIDPRLYAANVQQADAELAIAKAQASLAEKEYARAQELVKTQAISEKTLDERENASIVAKANVARAEAALIQAQINFDYAHIKAPISGTISRAEIKEGNIVEPGPNAPVLTTIVSDEGIYADFDIDEQTYLKYIHQVDSDLKRIQEIPVRLYFDEDQHSEEGHIHSFDNRINTSTGTIRARAYFPNHHKTLLPGMYGRIEISSPQASSLILVSERAIGTNQDRKFVYVINQQSQVEYREVTLGAKVDHQRIILSGLNQGDVVISEGINRIRPNMFVVSKPQPTLTA